MIKPIHILLFMLLLHMQCQTANIILPQHHGDDYDIYPTEYTSAWYDFFSDTHLKLGDYETIEVNRGWATSTDLTLIAHYRSFEQDIHIRLVNTKLKDTMDIFSVIVLNESGVSLNVNNNNRLFGLNYPLDYKNAYSGEITSPSFKSDWYFVIDQAPPSSLLAGGIEFSGILGSSRVTMRDIEIRPIQKIDSPYVLEGTEIYGYGFYKDREFLGAISMINEQRLWLKKSIKPEVRSAITSVSVALLLKHGQKNTFVYK